MKHFFLPLFAAAFIFSGCDLISGIMPGGNKGGGGGDDKGFLVSFDGNGNETGTPPAGIRSETTIQLPEAPDMTKEGYIFFGWLDKNTGWQNTPKNTYPGSGNLTKDTTLYAVWHKSWKIEYEANGGTGEAPEPRIVEDGLNISIDEPSNLTYTGMAFDSWNTASAGDSGEAFEAGQRWEAKNDLLLYARWSGDCKLYYNKNGNDVTGSAPDAETGITIGESRTVAGKGDLIRVGYRFNGWNTKSGADGTNYQPGDSVIADRTITLYAEWVKVWTLSYNGNGNSGGTLPTGGINDDGATITVAASSGFSKAGYIFKQWNTAQNGSGTVYAPGATFELTSDITLYAIWLKTWTLSYNANGGGGTVPQEILCTEGIPPVVADRGSITDKNGGYDFNNWNTAVDGSGTTYAPGATISDAASGLENITLYAMWSANGTVENNPKIISDTAGLAAINNYPARFYKIGENFTIEDTVVGSTVIGWTPLCAATPFTGKLDGNNKTITIGTTFSMNIAVNGSSAYAGIFARAGNGAVIKNLRVSGTLILSAYSSTPVNYDNLYAGVLAGYASAPSGVIEIYCDTVDVAFSVDTSNITRETLSVYSGILIGGLGAGATVAACKTAGSLSVSAKKNSSVGGISGLVEAGGKITASYNEGVIERTIQGYGIVASGSYQGMDYWPQAGFKVYAGGIAGESSGTVEYSMARGTVSCKIKTAADAGDFSNLGIANPFTDIPQTTDYGTVFYGGIVGHFKTGTLKSCVSLISDIYSGLNASPNFGVYRIFGGSENNRVPEPGTVFGSADTKQNGATVVWGTSAFEGTALSAANAVSETWWKNTAGWSNYFGTTETAGLAKPWLWKTGSPVLFWE